MQEAELFVLARAFHVVGVVMWIGGVAFVTTVLLPSIKRLPTGTNRLEIFEQLENRFSWQAKLTTLITGLSGFYMLHSMDAWDRYLQPQFWWLHLMTLVWLLFTAVLFVLEPLFLHRWFHEKAAADSDRMIVLLQAMHSILLLLSLSAVLAAVAGAHGYFWL